MIIRTHGVVSAHEGIDLPPVAPPRVARNADRPCATNAASGELTTFAQHLDRTSRLIGGLRTLGVGRGDRFAVMTLNSPAYLELYHAAFLGGGIINPLNLRFAPKELAYVLRDSETRVCFVDAFFAGLIDSVRADAGLEKVVLVGSGDVPHDITYADLLASANPVIPDEGEEIDPAVLMYTGGTTGLPKGVLLDQRAEILNCYHVMMTLQFERDSINLMQTPMFHAASMFGVLGGPALGAHSVIVPMFEPKAVMTAVETYRPSITTMVPTMIGLTMAHPEFRPSGGQLQGSGLRSIADAPCPARKSPGAVPGHERLAGLRHDRELERSDPSRSRRTPCRRELPPLGRSAAPRRFAPHRERGGSGTSRRRAG